MYFHIRQSVVFFFVVILAINAHGASVIDSGTSEPINPGTGQEFYRTDLGLHEIYDGGMWVGQDLEVVNVKAFGATGDGITDDTAAIQNAINAVPSKGGVVFLPTGTYTLTSTLTLKPHLALIGSIRRGSGTYSYTKGSTLLSKHDGNCLSFSYESDTGANILIEGVFIKGYKETYSTGHGVYFKNALDGELRNVIIALFPENNFHIEGGRNFHIQDCYSSHGGLSTYYIDSPHAILQKAVSDGGLYSLIIGPNADSADVRGGHFEGASVAGVKISNPNSTKIMSCIITNGTKGIVLDGSVATTRRLIIFANVINGYGVDSVGIELDDATANQIQINNNRICDYQTGIRDYTAGNNVIDGNIIFGQGPSGIGLDISPSPQARSIVVSNNIIEGDSSSVRHQSGDNVIYISNFALDSNGNSKPMDIITGNPIIIPEL